MKFPVFVWQNVLKWALELHLPSGVGLQQHPFPGKQWRPSLVSDWLQMLSASLTHPAGFPEESILHLIKPSPSPQSSSFGVPSLLILVHLAASNLESKLKAFSLIHYMANKNWKRWAYGWVQPVYKSAGQGSFCCPHRRCQRHLHRCMDLLQCLYNSNQRLECKWAAQEYSYYTLPTQVHSGKGKGFCFCSRGRTRLYFQISSMSSFRP